MGAKVPGSCASKRRLASISRILCQRTTFSANLQDPQLAHGFQHQDLRPQPADDLQRQPHGSAASKRFIVIQRQPRDPRPANDHQRAPTPEPPNLQQTTRSAKVERQLPTSTASQRLTTAPTFRILGQPFSANFLDPRQANDVQRRLRGFLASKTHPTPVSRILGQQTLQHQPSGSSASKRQRKSRASLSCKQAAYQDPRQGSVILRQQTSLSVDLQDHVPANDFQRQPPRSSASKRPAAPKIPGQQTAFSSNF